MSVGYCTLAIHKPYRDRAKTLFADAPTLSWTVLTDEPDDFRDAGVIAVGHQPTGPMAIDYLERLAPTGRNRGAAAYHDKRFALLRTLDRHDTAVFLDADSRFSRTPPQTPLPPGIAVVPFVRRTVAEHLDLVGTWRKPYFEALALHLTGNGDILHQARWCQESLLAITKDGREAAFFEAWSAAARFVQERELFSGEGGVIGMAAALAGWEVNYTALHEINSFVVHESGGPKTGA